MEHSNDPPGRLVALLHSPRAHVTGWGFDRAGDLLAIWQRGWSQGAPEEFAVRSSSGRLALGRAPSGTILVGAVAGGWVVQSRSHWFGLVGRDATETALDVSGTTSDARSSDRLVALGDRVFAYRHGRLLRLDLRVPSPSGTSADVVGSDGERVVVVLSRPLADGVDASRVAGVAESSDRGRTWRVSGVPPGIDEALGLVVMPDGTAYVATGTGQLLRARPGQPAVVVPGIRLVSVGHRGGRLYAMTLTHHGGTRPRLHVSSDGGRSWVPAPLPGRAR